MTRLLFIRHAHCEPVGITLAGRAPGIPLDGHGRRQAASLARRLRRENVTAIYSSPLERAVETADIIAALHGSAVTTSDAFNELDFGDWTGRTLESLQGDEDWHAFNRLRSVVRAPAGESMTEAMTRAVAEVLRLRERHDGGTTVIVTHADIIRAVLCHFLGMPLDHLLRLRIDTACISELCFHGAWPELVRLNAT